MPLREGHLSVLWPLFPVLIAISLWFGVKAGGDNLLKNDIARYGIGSLERAGSAAEAQRIISSWEDKAYDPRSQLEIDSDEGRMLTDVARRSLIFDLVFIVFYTSAMAVACLLAAAEIAVRRRKQKSRLVGLGIYLAYLQILTAGVDVIENVALWRMLTTKPVSNPWPWIAYTCSITKYALLAISLFYVLLAFVFWVIDHRRPPVRNVIAART